MKKTEEEKKKFIQRFDFLQNIKEHQYISFGAYEQDNNTTNGKEDIEWLVLEVRDGKALVISKYALDCKQYNTDYTDVTWEDCTLRKWLNNDFINAAFSAEEKAMIPTVTVSADKNLYYSTNPGNATQDQVFLLSIAEVNKYFSSDSDRQCKPTDYAIANGVWDDDDGNCMWWLRSPGSNLNYATFVECDGDFNVYGDYGNYADFAVRPALWIDLNSYIIFGAYPQDNNTANGKEDIEWLVLEVKEGKALVISKYALDCKQYNTNNKDVTWEDCTLRKWLNNDFINAAFSAEEKAMIATVNVSADKNPVHSTNPGNATQDKVFLLSITEAEKYFSSGCKPTDYAVSNGAYVDSDEVSCPWWLRSPGRYPVTAAFVSISGVVCVHGSVVGVDDIAVRPALWIDTQNLFLEVSRIKIKIPEKKRKKLIQRFDSLQNIKEHQYIIFGAYEQDNNTANGKEDIEWLVLEVKDGKALIISKYALDCKPYNTSFTEVSWEDCTLRKWLNNNFINASFSAEEKTMIQNTTVFTNGIKTTDKVFLLSITEAEKYFISDNLRQCKPTDYAVANGAWKGDNGDCIWWLRSPGDDYLCAAFVDYDLGVFEGGCQVHHDYAIRPALWIDLNS